MNKKKLVMTGAIALAAFVPCFAEEERCVEEGETVVLEFEPPPLGGPVDPIGAQYVMWGKNKVAGCPQAYEEDVFEDDHLGNGVPLGGGGGSRPGAGCGVPMSNHGGLPGTGGLDGDCAEVYTKWKYTYTLTVSAQAGVSFLGAPGGMGGGFTIGRSTSYQTIECGFKKSETKEICPC